MAGSTGPNAERYVHTPKTQELMANTETVVVLECYWPINECFLYDRKCDYTF